MPVPAKPLTKLGFLTIGLFDGADPRPGHESTLQIIQLGEQLGFDSAWVRHRHLQYGISSPLAILAAATQRTSRIELGTAVTPLGWENPLRLAEDFATVDILSGGRLNPGISVGPPMRWDEVKHALYPDTAEMEDFSYERVLRLLRWIRGEPATDFSGVEGIEVFSDRVQPHSPGLANRLWYGGASLRSAQWAGENTMNLLASSVVKAEESENFAEVQLSHIRTFRAHHPDGERARVSQGLVVIPTDSAVCGVSNAAHRESAGTGAVDVRGRPGRHIGRDRREAVRARGVPGSRRGRVRPAVQLRARRLRADPHRHRHEARSGSRLAANRLIDPGAWAAHDLSAPDALVPRADQRCVTATLAAWPQNSRINGVVVGPVMATWVSRMVTVPVAADTCPAVPVPPTQP
jgi:alkanesulfonate monooxygenase SsuD/methylene tetrahydromethanopterin reductase-like flavin-dependent oxidoreductase (luciferase family)